MSIPYEYIVYIDEAGDPGIKTVHPIDNNGASEWFTLGCVVIRARNEARSIEFIREVKTQIRSTQNPDLHFRKLKQWQREAVCKALASEEVRCFVVASNKKNMRGYKNPAAEAVSLHPNDWFYNYCIRILMERVTAWCANRSLSEYGETRFLKPVFSKRGGHSYRHVETYGALLAIQGKQGRVYQNVRIPDFRVLHKDLFEVEQAASNAGCQMADIVASAFFQAVNHNARNWSTKPAELLAPRMSKLGNNLARNEGVTLLPWSNWNRDLAEQQKLIFRTYGYQF